LKEDVAGVLSLNGIRVRLNEFTGRLTVSMHGEPEHPMEELDLAAIQIAIQDATRRPGRPGDAGQGGIPKVYAHILDACLTKLGAEDSYHPVRDYLDSLRWDGKLRLDHWLSQFMGADDTPYTQAVGRLTLEAAVKRVREPGCKFDECLVLVGPEGIGKSTVLRTLGEPWFSDSLPLGADPKETVERTNGVWICESAELIGNSPSKVHEIKAFLSRQEDGPFRAAYARTSSMRKRQFVPIATTNDAVFLHSTTGDRRFWPVRVHYMDAKGLDRDQLWAEANWRAMLGEPIRLDPRLWDEAQGGRPVGVGAATDRVGHDLPPRHLAPAGRECREGDRERRPAGSRDHGEDGVREESKAARRDADDLVRAQEPVPGTEHGADTRAGRGPAAGARPAGRLGVRRVTISLDSVDAEE